MGDSRTRAGGTRGRLCAAGAACAAAIGFSGPAEAQSANPLGAARGAAGVIVHYEEAPGSNVIYMEEGGGMVSAIAAPVPVGRKPPPAAAQAKAERAAERPARKSPGTATRVAQRRDAPPEGAGGRP